MVRSWLADPPLSDFGGKLSQGLGDRHGLLMIGVESIADGDCPLLGLFLTESVRRIEQWLAPWKETERAS